MGLLDFWSLIIDNLARRKVRVALTAVGVIIGTASVILLVSLGIGLQRDATERLGSGSNLTLIQVWPNWEGPPNADGSITPSKLLTDDTIAEILPLPAVAAVVPWDGFRGWGFVAAGRLEGGGAFYGYGTNDLADVGVKVEQGTSQLERGTIILGGMMAKNFYDPRKPQEGPVEIPDLLDKQVTLVLVKWSEDGTEVRKKVPLRVAGILAAGMNETDWSMYVNLDDMNRYNAWFNSGKPINHTKEGYNGITVRAAELSGVVGLAEQIVALGYQAWTMAEAVQNANSFYTTMQILLGSIGAISLLVAAIGIANTMAMAILERTREIGLMKAVGATNRDVLTVFLGEAAGIGFLGGLGGVVAGWALGQVLNVIATAYLAGQAATMGTPPPTSAVYTPAWLPVFVLVFATVIGFLSGLYPALNAATMAPVTALKYE
jgi:putative ABC transport system permease protein